ncbi:MAG: fasciclin domain-containing protein [Desulfosarcinaceae bacterium]|jgi:uncharacterized surface protein with fasciclin (FAS1) repeats
MRPKTSLIFLVLFVCIPSLALAGGYGKKAMKMDIVDTAVSAGSFNTLVAALKAAELDGELRKDGPFTVFAPTDAAFGKLAPETLNDLLKPENRDKLQAILTYHVVPGSYTAKQVVGMRDAETANGRAFTISTEGDNVMVDEAKVIQTDILASNGIIHVIDTVIIPE